ncbi:mutator protein MutT [Asanoa ferruginea]|uniref:Mutator protein MutT n=1 Tax=Asanoa ferruginea TaxID=53367 RepID=A0A3D9ZH99_9ACTN|nr:NUDIX domain-containing protein [Asanoa ferruginea]REF96229.1 mutator protein MutT [Asanoa ferruginea]
MSVEPLRCAAGVIVDDDGRVFIQRRSPTRKLFPDTWDVVGGHLEPGETIDEALRREVEEETGWRVSIVLGTIGEHRYFGEDGLERLETDFLIRVDGDLSRPRLEAGKHTSYKWISRDELDVLDENKDIDGGLVRQIIEGGFALLRQIGL